MGNAFVILIQVADIFAVGLQDHCWHCNKDDMLDIPTEFLKRLSDSGQCHSDYETMRSD